MLDLQQELYQMSAALDAQGIAYALIGGLAVSLYAKPRATEDIDILILPSDVERSARALAPLGYEVTTEPMTFAGGRISIHCLTKLAGEDFVVLDLLLASDAVLADILAQRSQIASDRGTLWVVQPDGLRALKRMRHSPQDQADIAALDACEADPGE